MRIHRRSGIAAVFAIALAMFGVVGSVSAAGNTLRIDPASQTVAKGTPFTVKVVQNASVATIGAQASVTFDSSKLQITSVAWGSAYASAPVLVPSDIASAISKANTSGKLAEFAATFFQATDAIPAGDADFLSITFTATGCGTVPLGLPVGPSDALLLDGSADTIGNTLPVTTAGGSITVDCTSTATSAAATSAATPATATSATATPATATATSAAASSTVSAEPTTSVAATTSTETTQPTSSAASTEAPVVPAGAGSTTSGSDGGFPLLWLFLLLLAVPAVAIVGLGLRRRLHPERPVRPVPLAGPTRPAQPTEP